MTTFAGWNFFGASAAIINVHGINVMMNLFFGVTVNAARGIATKVNDIVYLFVTNFMLAMNPQITKSYAQGDYRYMHSLVCCGAKFSFFLILFFLIPLWLETHQMLVLWLGVVPEYAVSFVQLTLVSSALNVLTNTLDTGPHASGRLKRYMLIVGSVEITNFPLTYVAFKMGCSTLVSYYIYLGVYFILMHLRLYLVKDLIHMKASLFVRKVYLRVLLVGITASVVPLLVYMPQEGTLFRLPSVCLVSFTSTAACAYLWGLDGDESALITGYIKKKIRRDKKQ